MFFIALICIIPLFATSQSTLEALQRYPISKYLMVYSERFIKDDTQSGYYFIIDEGRKDIKNTLDSLKGNMVITDSTFYLKDKKGVTVSFESTIGFLNYMNIYGWEFICNQYPGNGVLMKDIPTKEIYVFLLRKTVK